MELNYVGQKGPAAPTTTVDEIVLETKAEIMMGRDRKQSYNYNNLENYSHVLNTRSYFLGSKSTKERPPEFVTLMDKDTYLEILKKFQSAIDEANDKCDLRSQIFMSNPCIMRATVYFNYVSRLWPDMGYLFQDITLLWLGIIAAFAWIGYSFVAFILTFIVGMLVDIATCRIMKYSKSREWLKENLGLKHPEYSSSGIERCFYEDIAVLLDKYEKELPKIKFGFRTFILRRDYGEGGDEYFDYHCLQMDKRMESTKPSADQKPKPDTLKKTKQEPTQSTEESGTPQYATLNAENV